MHVWSFFSGSMGLDLGLERTGFSTTVAFEKDKSCRETIKLNRPKVELPGDGDVEKIDFEKIRQEFAGSDDIFLIHGGPPCQSFSSGGKRAALSDPRGNLIYRYLQAIAILKPRYFVLENVANITTAALRHRKIEDRPGHRWNLKSYSNNRNSAPEYPDLDPDELAGSAIQAILDDIKRLGYSVNFDVLDSADFGAPQQRLRFVLIAAREGGVPPLPSTTHSSAYNDDSELPPSKTVREAIEDLQHNPGPHSTYSPEVAQYFSLVPPGGNWRDLPRDLQLEAMGKSYYAGGGKTGFFRRLAWDRPAPTITGRPNRKGGAMCHPNQVRPISVSECARLQGFADTWKFTGSMSNQYLQIGNAVPTQLAAAIGRSIEAHSNGHFAAPREFSEMLEVAQFNLRKRARNRKSAKKKPTQEEMIF